MRCCSQADRTALVTAWLVRGLFVSVRRGAGSPLAEARRYFESKPALIRRGRAAALVTVIDEVIHDYEEVVRFVEVDIEQVEAQVFSLHAENPAERIYRLSREVAQFARAIAPLTAELDRLARGHFDAVPRETRPDFRDAHTQLLRVETQVSGCRDLLTSILHANLAQIAVRQNEDMRSITAWVGILAIPTMVAGVYGMNFDPCRSCTGASAIRSSSRSRWPRARSCGDGSSSPAGSDPEERPVVVGAVVRRTVIARHEPARTAIDAEHVSRDIPLAVVDAHAGAAAPRQVVLEVAEAPAADVAGRGVACPVDHGERVERGAWDACDRPAGRRSGGRGRARSASREHERGEQREQSHPRDPR